MKILVTGAAGFIGFHLSQKFLKQENEVIGIDNLNDYYDPSLKKARLKILQKYPHFSFYKLDISNFSALEKVFQKDKFTYIVHLAAQAGVRYSLTHPFVYEKSNMLGFLNVLELMKKYNVKNLVFASSSSVYGGIKEIPFREEMNINKPISLYAATKAANELYAYVYHHLYGINAVGLRFFTVYGPWGRPDMVLFLFTKAILENKPIKVFNYGKMKRDFTYVDDIVAGIIASLSKVSQLGYEIFNLGRGQAISLTVFINYLEKELGKKAKKKMLPYQPGDVLQTFADISRAKKYLGYNPQTKIREGIKKFAHWYREYYKVQ